MSSGGGTLQHALSLQQAGRLAEAEQIYRQLLAADPRLSEPHLYLALIEQARGQLSVACDSCQRALALRPDYAEAHFALGNLLNTLGQGAQAEACFRQALAANRLFFPAHVSLASLLRRRGQFDEARTHLNCALAIDPGMPNSWYVLGNLEVACRNYDAARVCYETALRLKPDWADAHARIGVMLQAQERLDEAVGYYRRALELQPRHAEAHYNFGTALAALGRPAEAQEHYQSALAIDPRHLGAHVNLGAIDQSAGRDAEALAHYSRAIEIDPAAAEAHLNRGLLLLAEGRLGEAWPDYDWRVRVSHFPVRRIDKPLWDGSDLAGRRLLVHAEQGLGDTLHFVRYLRLLAARGVEPIVQVQAPLVPLLAESGYERLVADDEPTPQCDVQIPLLSLPGVFRTTLKNVPSEVPYLHARDQDVARWRDRLASLDGFRVGIAWQGSATHQRDRERSIPLAAFAPLARIEGVKLVSLQKHSGTEQLRDAPFAIHRLGDEWDPPSRPLVDTAAVMMNLDLVVTADTAIAHLAGGLAARVWVALSTPADWRWMTGRTDSPWYPTMRLFRQSCAGDWGPVMSRIAEELAAARRQGRLAASRA